MAESTLSIRMTDLFDEVGDYLGMHPDQGEWLAGDVAKVTRYVNSALSKFYHHPRTQTGGNGFQWSFLSPTMLITTVTDQDWLNLPDDFASMIGPLRFTSRDTLQSRVNIVGESQVRQYQQQLLDSTNVPEIAFIQTLRSAGVFGQKSRIIFTPTPDDAYVLTGNYNILPNALTTENPIPLGGAIHRDTIIAACLSEAELRANDRSSTIHAENYQNLLEGSVALDMRNRPEVMGLVMDPSIEGNYSDQVRLADVFYNGVELI